jgi:hypothetical protein
MWVFAGPLQVMYRDAAHAIPAGSRCFSRLARVGFRTRGISQGKSYRTTEKITAVSGWLERLAQTTGYESGHTEEMTPHDAVACCLLTRECLTGISGITLSSTN